MSANAMHRTLLTALLALLVLTPGAQAWPWDREVEIEIPAPLTGDKLRYIVEHEIVRADDAEGAAERQGEDEGPSEAILLREGRSTAIDAFGIERATYATREDMFRAGELTAATRCHRLVGGPDRVATHWLAGTEWGHADSWSNGALGIGLLETRTDTQWNGSTVASFGGSGCGIELAVVGTLREGESVRLIDILPIVAEELADPGLSAPGIATEHRGRVALRFEFDARDVFGAAAEMPDDVQGTLAFVLADGLPDLAEMRAEMHGDEASESWRVTLEGFDRGNGEAWTVGGTTTLPERHPSGRFAPPSPLILDDAALDLPIPYDAAFAALRDDPSSGFAVWSAAHPDAVLSMAFFDVNMGRAGFALAPGVASEGGWMLMFTDEAESHTWMVSALSGVETPVLPLASPQALYKVDDLGTSDPLPTLPATEAADSATLAATAAAQGIAVGTIRALTYTAPTEAWPHAFLVLSQVTLSSSSGSDEGLMAILDVGTGGTALVLTQSIQTTSTGFLPLGAVEAPIGERAPGTFAALSSPESLAVSAAATAAGLGLLLLLVKTLLLPLYTRLRRDRLLDNPVRARLYEHVRAEPGIHRAELVDYAGIGEGATRHHLAQLVKHKLLVELAPEGSGFARYFAAGEVPPDVARREANLRAGSQRAVYELYAREPQLTLRDAAARLGMSAPSVHRAKKKLEAAGLLPAAPASSAAVAEA